MTTNIFLMKKNIPKQARNIPALTINEYNLKSMWSINFAKTTSKSELNVVAIAYTSPNWPSVKLYWFRISILNND